MSEWGAIAQSRRLDHQWIGPEHFLLALLAEPSVASETLEALGVTYERFAEQVRSARHDPDLPARAGERTGILVNPAAHELIGWARGLAAAAGFERPRPADWLVALLYADERCDMWLQAFGTSARTVADALAARGVVVPAWPAPEHRPWRGARHVYVSEAELEPALKLLNERHPPGTEWRWGFNNVGEPRRGRITAEEGIDLDAIVAEIRPPRAPR
jgi:Clp amino terminal domain, pathogenicity island component